MNHLGIKIIQNGFHKYAARDEDILPKKHKVYNLMPLTYSLNLSLDDKYVVQREDTLEIAGLRQGKIMSALLPDDVIRKPNIEEYIFLSNLFKKYGVRYNKKKGIGIMVEK